MTDHPDIAALRDRLQRVIDLRFRNKWFIPSLTLDDARGILAALSTSAAVPNDPRLCKHGQWKAECLDCLDAAATSAAGEKEQHAPTDQSDEACSHAQREQGKVVVAGPVKSVENTVTSSTGHEVVSSATTVRPTPTPATPEKLSLSRFTCPECGSHEWGTSNGVSAFEKWIGHCHGYKSGRPCHFSWPRTDDAKYIQPETATPEARSDLPEPRRFACFTMEDGVYEHAAGEHVAYADWARLRDALRERDAEVARLKRELASYNIPQIGDYDR